jgi:NAD(P)-dependent dehydrogenase (short-subunit alcohol dehydrogenase family)
MMERQETALIVGAGPGLGAALARRFAHAGMNVAIAARNISPLQTLARDIGGGVRGFECDATDEGAVTQLFDRVTNECGAPNVIVFNAGAFVHKGLLETGADEFERCWKISCFGGFLVGREAVRRMLAGKSDRAHRGTVLFTGATASRRGGAAFHNLAVGKFGLRALAQSMAREFQPQGIHVAHVVIDGQIASDRPGRRTAERGADAVLDPDAIAETYYQLHRQPSSAWTLELDLRPRLEKF